MHEDEERSAALDPAPWDQPSTAASQVSADAAWPFPTAASVAVAASVAPIGSCRYLHLESGTAACLALAPVVALSTRQVELMCLGPAHAHCPRFVHGGTGERPLPAPTSGAPIVAVATTVRRDDVADGSPEAVLAPSGSWLEVTGVAATADTLETETGGQELAPEAETLTETLAETADDAETAEASPEQDAGTRADEERTPDPATQPPDETDALDDGTATETGDDRSRPDDASDTEGLAGLAAAAAVAGSGAAETGTGSGPATEAAPRTAPVKGPTRPRADGLRMSQAHERSIALRPSIIVATLVLAAAIVAAFAFVAARGGLVLPQAGSPSASLVAAASQPAAHSSPSPSRPASTSPVPSSSSVATSTTAPSPTPSRAPAASPTPAASSAGAPWTAAQLAVLKPCPGKADCWQYRIHSGDNLHGVAKFFGVTYPALLAANPQITNPSLIHVGEVIVIPTPGA
ncbi:MAG TPA: LysM peptidoglycan-binding domain-containing protein [Candidatus Binatia bacterium]|nr:LysM peptidoglycan-binding domain-containing protein [Candidatus Binatia bacterium]